MTLALTVIHTVLTGSTGGLFGEFRLSRFDDADVVASRTPQFPKASRPEVCRNYLGRVGGANTLVQAFHVLVEKNEPAVGAAAKVPIKLRRVYNGGNGNRRVFYVF